MIASILLSGCSTQNSPAVASANPTTADWKIGEYSITFRAGPSESQRSFSSYEVSRKFESLTYPSVIAIESAQSLERLHNNLPATPADHIKLTASSSGKTLLIVEDVPNDCAPCVNWILVRGEDDSLIYDYLVLPSRLIKPGDIFEEDPTVTRVTENEISFRYSDGMRRTVPVRSVIKTEKRPTFPG